MLRAARLVVLSEPPLQAVSCASRRPAKGSVADSRIANSSSGAKAGADQSEPVF